MLCQHVGVFGWGISCIHQSEIQNDRLDVIEILFKRFCEIYAGAENDQWVLRILARQYLEVLYYSQFPKQLQVLRRFWSSLSQSPQISAPFFYELRSAVKQIPGHLKYWIPRNLLGADI